MEPLPCSGVGNVVLGKGSKYQGAMWAARFQAPWDVRVYAVDLTAGVACTGRCLAASGHSYMECRVVHAVFQAVEVVWHVRDVVASGSQCQPSSSSKLSCVTSNCRTVPRYCHRMRPVANWDAGLVQGCHRPVPGTHSLGVYGKAR